MKKIETMTVDPQRQDASLICCSFCGKGRSDVKALISGPGNIYICDECVGVCSDICGTLDGAAKQHEELRDKFFQICVLRVRVAELEVERDRMLPIYTAHLAAEQRAAERRERERQRVAGLTEHELHCEHRHPDYEYEMTENARKSGDSPIPQGEGWEPNEIIECHIYKDGVVLEERWRNWTRGDFTETNYWRRKKPAKEQP